jgi:hypothetical protein
MKITIVSATLLVVGAMQFTAAQTARQIWLQDGREPKTQPASAMAGSAGFTMTVTGTGFATGAAVLWNNQALNTTFASSTQLVAKVPAALIAMPGMASVTVAGAGVTSPPATFTITPAAVQARNQVKPKPPKNEPGHQEVATGTAVPKPNSQPYSGPAGLTSTPDGTSAVFAQVTLQPLGIRYSLLRIANGSSEQVSPDSTFHSGDWVKVKVEGNRDGFLYVVSRGSGGNWNVLFPSAIEGGDNRLKARREYQVPSGQNAFHFDDQVGEEKLFIVYSAQPVEDLDALIFSLRKPEQSEAPGSRTMAQNSSVNDDLVSKLRDIHSRDLLIDRLPGAQQGESKPENAVYVVNGSGGRVVADIALKHK